MDKHKPLECHLPHQLVRGLASALLVLALAACGGGGGGAGSPVLGGGETGTPGGTSTDYAVVTLELSSTTVTAGAPATVTATVKNKAGAAVPGLVVRFSSESNLASFSATSALTDANGVATVVLSPAVATASGADAVKASVSYVDKPYSASTGFQLSATNVTIQAFDTDVAALSAFGQANLTVTLAGSTPNSPVSLAMTSSCTSAGKGTLTPSTQVTSTGRATFTFRDGGCGASQSRESLQVSVVGSTATRSLEIPVASPKVASIGFIEAKPSTIYLRGSGLEENSTVTFKVKDESGNGLPEQNVDLTLNVLVGGVTLDGGSGTVRKKSDKDGNVVVRINSGTVPTPVRIKATLVDSTISTVSSNLSIGVGLPSQLNFSLAQGSRNIEGYSIDGTPNTYTVIASDRLGNPVPIGTAINFVTEGGTVESSKKTVLDSSGLANATANLKSSSPVPRDGRVTVVAYALGEKSFLDTNGDNVYTKGEQFQDLGDIFLDRKYDAFFSVAEDQFVSATASGDQGECVVASSPLLATDVSIPIKPKSCNGQWGGTYVRRAIQTIFSTSEPRPLWGRVWPSGSFASGGVCASPIPLILHYLNDVEVIDTFKPFGGSALYGQDRQGVLSLLVADNNPIAFNPMAAGTVVTASGTEGLAVSVLGGSPVPSTSTPTYAAISYKFDDKTTSGAIVVSFKSPSGLGVSITQSISMNGAPSGFSVCSN